MDLSYKPTVVEDKFDIMCPACDRIFEDHYSYHWHVRSCLHPEYLSMHIELPAFTPDSSASHGLQLDRERAGHRGGG